jgi:cobalt/nickel transport system permease protein
MMSHGPQPRRFHSQNRLDPRVKIFCLLIFLLCVISTEPGALLSFALYGLLIAVLIGLSRIPLHFILKRFLVVLPFVLMTALFLPFMGGAEGWTIFRTVVIKAALSILCMTLFIAGTPFPELLKAMERMGFPKLITMILSFMYRYFFLIQDEAMRLWQAKRSRSAGGSARTQAKAVSGMIGVLFIRSFERAESVYLAMCSRGYDGTIRTAERFQVGWKDIVFLFAMAVFLVHIRMAGNG